MYRSAIVLPVVLMAAPALAEPAPPPQPERSESSQPAATPQNIVRELQELRAMRRDLQRQMGEFDNRIRTLEGQLGAPVQADAAGSDAPANMAPAPAITATRETDQMPALADGKSEAPKGRGGQNDMGEQGIYEPGRGFVLVRDDEGELGIGLYTYARYLNQMDLNSSYIDAFGRTQLIDRRNDIDFRRSA